MIHIQRGIIHCSNNQSKADQQKQNIGDPIDDQDHSLFQERFMEHDHQSKAKRKKKKQDADDDPGIFNGNGLEPGYHFVTLLISDDRNDSPFSLEKAFCKRQKTKSRPSSKGRNVSVVPPYFTVKQSLTASMRCNGRKTCELLFLHPQPSRATFCLFLPKRPCSR